MRSLYTMNLLVLAASLLTAPAGAQAQEESVRSAPVTTATLKSLLAAFNAHDLDAIMGYFAEDCVLLMPRGPEPEGRRLVNRRKCKACRLAASCDVRAE